jgi:methyl-accepting chemotaxis protein
MLRTHFIVKPRIQIKYLLISLFVVCLTAVAVYYAFWSALAGSPGLEELSAGDWHALARAYNTSFIWVVLILAIAIPLESIFLFHRLIGPVFVFERTAKAVSNGDLTVSAHIRKADELKELSGDMDTMIMNLRQAVKDDRQKLDEIKELLNQGKITQAKDRLSEVTQWYKI